MKYAVIVLLNLSTLWGNVETFINTYATDRLQGDLKAIEQEYGDQVQNLQKPKKPQIPPAIKLTKGEFEKTLAFNERIKKAKQKRLTTIKQIQSDYASSVEQYNRQMTAIKKAQKEALDDYKKTLADQKAKYLIEGYMAYYGDLYVGKDLIYDADSEQFFTTLKSTKNNFKKPIAIKVPPSQAKAFKAAHDALIPSIEFSTSVGKIILRHIAIAFEDEPYEAFVTDGKVDIAQVDVTINDGKVLFDELALLDTSFEIDAQAYDIGKVDYGISNEIAKLNQKDFEALQKRNQALLQGDDLLDLLKAKKPAPKDPKTYAVVFGIEDYNYESAVTFSSNSALAFVEYAVKLLGVPEENVWLFVGKDTTAGAIKSQWVDFIDNLEEGDKVYWYYSGHGIPSLDGEAYILPSDMSAKVVDTDPSFALKSLYKDLSSSQASQIVAFIDSCFSGKDDQGETLDKGVAAALLKKKSTPFNDKKMTIFTAGTQNQFSNQYAQKQHRLFSYYLMKGLSEGKSDAKDLHRYIKSNVFKQSRKLGKRYHQTPQIQGNAKVAL